MGKMDDKLRQLQLSELEILKEFVRICEKHHLKYVLTGGTLLGAVRHGGFIPWDDDIDVAMLRADYDRFAQLCKDELGPKFFYQSPATDPYYFLTYAKIRKNGTEIYEERFRKAKFHKGIFIDIFPLDFCPKPGLLCHFLFNVLAVMNYRGQVDSGEKYVPYQELAGKIGYLILKVLSPRQSVGVRRLLLRLSKNISRKVFVSSYSGAYGYHKEVFPYAWVEPRSKTQFEAFSCCIPENTMAILKQLYGEDYMSPRKTKTHLSTDVL